MKFASLQNQVRENEMKKQFGSSAVILVAFVMTLFLFTSGTAMDIYSSQVLPSPANGGVATYVYRFNDVYAVTGFVKPTANTTQAAMWEGPAFDAVTLPGLGGPNSLGDTGTHEVGHWAANVGSAQNPGGVWKPVLWVDGPGDTITVHQLPTLTGASGNAHSIGSKNGVYFIGGTTGTGTGASVATFWRWTDPITMIVRNLGTLGGMNSEITAQGQLGFNEITHTFLGRSQVPNGDWHACEWRSNDNGNTWSILDLSNGLVSAVTDFREGGLNTSTFGVGSGWATFPSGYTRGFMDYVDDFVVFPPTPGFNNSSIDTVGGTTFGARGAGTAWDLNNDGEYIYNSIRSINQHRAYPIGAVQEQGTDVDNSFLPIKIEIEGVTFSAIAGKSLISEIGMPALMTNTGDEVPDAVSILPTIRGGTIQRVNEYFAWHEDFFKVKVKRDTRSTNPSTIQFSFYGSYQDMTTDGGGWTALRTVGTGIPATRTATATVFISNTGGGTLNIGSQIIDGNMQNLNFSPFSGTGFVFPTGEMRIQVVITSPSSSVSGYEIDKIRLRRM